MRSFIQRSKEFLKNLSVGVFSGAVVVVGVVLFIFALSKFGDFADAYYPLLPSWVRGALGVSILAIPVFLFLAKWGEKIRDDWAANRSRMTLSR